jgi:hypothetical protein
MDSVHDMGGVDGFGKVEVEKNEPVFHAAWEGRVLAMQRAMAIRPCLEYRPIPTCRRKKGHERQNAR